EYGCSMSILEGKWKLLKPVIESVHVWGIQIQVPVIRVQPLKFRIRDQQMRYPQVFNLLHPRARLGTPAKDFVQLWPVEGRWSDKWDAQPKCARLSDNQDFVMSRIQVRVHVFHSSPRRNIHFT